MGPITILDFKDLCGSPKPPNMVLEKYVCPRSGESPEDVPDTGFLESERELLYSPLSVSGFS